MRTMNRAARPWRWAALSAALLVALGSAGIALADGEAGLVIDTGAGTETFCVAFEGEGITGDELLRRAGKEFDQFGGGARTLCSLDGLGCQDSSSFDGCFCECKSGSGACTYWAFFIQRYGGAWQYSTVGFNLAQVRDGDMHGWKWGSGSLQSAPPPAGVTFEDVCGHSPRAGQAPTPTPENTPTPSPFPTPRATTPASTAEATAAATTPSPSPAGSPSMSSTAATPASTGTPPVSATPVRTSPPPTVTVTFAADPPEPGDSGGSSAGTWASFGAVAALLGAGIAGGIAWRRRHGG